MITGRRIALIVGADKYIDRSLTNCVSDARMVEAVLRLRGFECVSVENPTLEVLRTAVAELRLSVSSSEICLFYYAGHAVEYGGSGFIMPCDFPPLHPALAAKHYMMPVAEVADALNSGNALAVIILDACRNWPVSTDDTLGLSQYIQESGLAQRKWNNTLIAFSTSAGDAALDGVAGHNSRFCLHFCKNFKRHDLTIEDCFKVTGQAVIKETNARQKPWYYSSLRAEAKFSDFAEFELITAYKMPFAPASLLSLTPARTEKTVLVAGLETHLWEVNLSGFRRSSSPKAGKIVSACVVQEAIALIDSEGFLSHSNGRIEAKKTSIVHPHGILTDGGTDVIIYGMDGWEIYRLIDFTWMKIARRGTSWSIHTGLVIAPGRAWLAGALGNLIEISWNKRKATSKFIGNINLNINVLSPLPNGMVLCGGDVGLLCEIDSADGKIIRDYQQDRQVTTMSMRRQSLMSRLDDGRILRYLFDRSSIDPAISEILDGCIEQNRVMFAHAAPKLPLLLSGSSEGIVTIIDSRDGQIVQRIDAQSGLGTEIQGVRFLSDSEFVSLSSAGAIRFYASQTSVKEHSGPFLRTEEEDRLLIESGLGDA